MSSYSHEPKRPTLESSPRRDPDHAAIEYDGEPPGGFDAWFQLGRESINASNTPLDTRIDQVEPIAFPHGDSIETALGQPVSGRAVVDPGRCRRRGVEAFTDGETTHFASSAPSLHVAAHEAAHLLQHGGATRDANLGAEGHAGAIADTVVTGGSARHLVGNVGAPITGAVHDYQAIRLQDQADDYFIGAGQDLMVSDDGKMAVGLGGDGQTLFAEMGLIVESNVALASKSSALQMYAADGPETIEGKAPADPDGETQLLFRVEPDLIVDPGLTTDDDEIGQKNLSWEDCGRTAREIMGPAGIDLDPVGVSRSDSGQLQETRTRSSDPRELLNEILVQSGLGATLEDARRKYDEMDDEERDRFDRDHGLNRYALPDVGEAYSIIPSAGRDENRFDANFHWAGVIMASGPDRVTLENFAGSKGYDRKNKDWSIKMYGSRSDSESFDGRWDDGFGRSAMTIRARTSSGGK